MGDRPPDHTGAKTTESLQISVFILSCLLFPHNKNNHTKLDPTRSFCPPPTSWVLGMGLEWEAGEWPVTLGGNENWLRGGGTPKEREIN